MSVGRARILVIDTGPLSHLSEAGWLGVLRVIAGDAEVIIPDPVADELRRGAASRPYLRQVLATDWIVEKPLTTPTELAAFAEFSSKLVAGERNVGEAAVLAYAQVHDAIAVVDDGAARKAGRAADLEIRPTLSLLTEGIRRQELTVSMVSHLADHLIETKYHLPFRWGGFADWAERNGLI